MAINWTVKVYPLKSQVGSIVANASLIIDEEIEITGFTIRDGKNGLWASPPSQKSNKTDENGKAIYFDTTKFLGERAEGERHTALQAEVLQAMLDSYQQDKVKTSRTAAAQAQTGTQSGKANSASSPPQKKAKPSNPLWD